MFESVWEWDMMNLYKFYEPESWCEFTTRAEYYRRFRPFVRETTLRLSYNDNCKAR